MLIISIGSILAIKHIMFPDYISWFKTYDKYLFEAIEALTSKGRSIIPYLKAEFIKRENIEEKKGILYVLGEIGDESGIETILNAMEDNNPDIRVLAIDALDNTTFQNPQMLKRKFIPILLKHVNDENISGFLFPYSTGCEGRRVNRVAMRYIAKSFDYEIQQKIEEIGFDTQEKRLVVANFIKQYWQENGPYLYWIPKEYAPTLIMDGKIVGQVKVLKVNEQAKLLGIPVDEDTGKMIDSEMPNDK